MQRYESYKPSGIQWVENIPSHWGAERAKWLFDRMERPIRPEDDVVTAFRDGQVTLRTNRRTEGFTNAIQEHGYQGIRKGDLVIHAMDAFAGAIGVSDSDGKSTPVYAACVPRGEYPVNSYYYAYLLRYMAHSGYIESLSKGIRERSTDFRFAEFRELPLPIPDKDEQDRIVAFLDQKTAEIDAAIAKKERLIELLNEKLQISIDQAVTSGLGNNQKLKNCGLDWTPFCPSGWAVRKVSHYFRAQKGREAAKLTKEYCGTIPGPYPVYSGQTENNGVMSNISNYEFDTGESGVLFSTTVGAKAMSVMHLTGRFSLSQNCMIIKPTSKDIVARFFFYQFQRIFSYYRGLIPDHMQASFRMEDLYRYYFLLPPLTEQIEIANHLDKKLAEINRAVDVIKVQIERLQEWRRALIAEAATGQINIRKVT